MQGQEVFSNYGHKSNEELFLSYGFVIPNNPADFLHVSLGFTDQAGSNFWAHISLTASRGSPFRHLQNRQALHLFQEHH